MWRRPCRQDSRFVGVLPRPRAPPQAHGLRPDLPHSPHAERGRSAYEAARPIGRCADLGSARHGDVFPAVGPRPPGLSHQWGPQSVGRDRLGDEWGIGTAGLCELLPVDTGNCEELPVVYGDEARPASACTAVTASLEWRPGAGCEGRRSRSTQRSAQVGDCPVGAGRASPRGGAPPGVVSVAVRTVRDALEVQPPQLEQRYRQRTSTLGIVPEVGGARVVARRDPPPPAFALGVVPGLLLGEAVRWGGAGARWRCWCSRRGGRRGERWPRRRGGSSKRGERGRRNWWRAQAGWVAVGSGWPGIASSAGVERQLCVEPSAS